MTCASCVARVEAALLDVPGVQQASVNLATEEALVAHGPSVSFQDLAEAMDAAGYVLELQDALQSPPERALAWRPVLWSLLLAAPVIALHFARPGVWNDAIQWLLCTVLLLTTGRLFFEIGFKALARFKPEMNSLIALGLSAAYGYSSVVMALGRSHGHGVLLMDVAMLVLFIRFGRALEERARYAAFDSLSVLLATEPKHARKVAAEGLVDCEVGELQVGDVIEVARGEVSPLDGRVVTGQSEFNEALITGEPLPVSKAMGSEVLAGSLNEQASVRVEVTRAGDDSTLRQLVRRVSQAQAAKAPIQRFADQIAAVFVPIVIGIASLTLLLWLSLGAGVEVAVSRAVAVLVIACPCALGLATPTAVVVGSSLALRHGLLVKRAPVLEALARVRCVAFDKTGTLTLGRPQYQQSLGEASGLEAAVSLAQSSSHPLSRALQRWGAEQGFEAEDCEDLEEIPGVGLKGRLHGCELALLSDRGVRERGIEIPSELEQQAQDLRLQGAAVTWFVRAGALSAGLVFRDGLRAEAGAAIKQLNKWGVSCVIISGDSQNTVTAVAEELSTAGAPLRALGELRPEDKDRAIQELKAEFNGPVAFVGDGINDALALSTADVGLAMGSGTAVARMTGDMVLLRGGIELLVQAVDISRRTLQRIRWNLFFATIYNALALPLAAGLFSPWGLEWPPSLAAMAMALSSVTVVTSSLLLARVEPHSVSKIPKEESL